MSTLCVRVWGRLGAWCVRVVNVGLLGQNAFSLCVCERCLCCCWWWWWWRPDADTLLRCALQLTKMCRCRAAPPAAIALLLLRLLLLPVPPLAVSAASYSSCCHSGVFMCSCWWAATAAAWGMQSECTACPTGRALALAPSAAPALTELLALVCGYFMR